MYQFIFTDHAIARFRERYSGNPVDIVRKASKAGKNIRKRIRQSCLAEGTSEDCVYLVNRHHDKDRLLIFVALVINDGDWLVKTFFTYDLEKK